MTLDLTYTTSSQTTAAMEPHASTAVWEGDQLTLYGSYEMPSSDRQQLAKALGVPAENSGSWGAMSAAVSGRS